MDDILKSIDDYYTNKIIEFGTTPKGVDWKDEKTQIIRIDQLLKIIINDDFSINDLGCGYGKLYEWLCKKFIDKNNFQYYGYDLSSEMIKKAKMLHEEKNCSFFRIKDSNEIKDADYTVASGIFNVKMGYLEHEWLTYILKTIDNMNAKSKKGFSFNILTKYSDKEYMRNDLFYADPCYFFDYCKRNYSKNISLLHDYDLYEFTILVRK